MANYPYIIASFPDLLLDFEQHPLDPHAVIAEVKSQLSENDGKLVDWLLFGLDGTHLTPHFYRNLKQSRNSFLISWFDFLSVMNLDDCTESTRSLSSGSSKSLLPR